MDITSVHYQNGQLNHISNMPYAQHVNMINFLATTGANFNIPNEVIRWRRSPNLIDSLC
jgi:hypothetical protein